MAWKFFTNTGAQKTSSVATIASALLGPVHVGATITGLVANQAYLTPITGIVTPTTITRFKFGIASTSGNMDIGIYYSDDNTTFTRLFSTGSFASPANSDGAVKTFAAQTITPVVGRFWYIALAADNGTVQFYHNAGIGVLMSYIKTTSFPLPASLTSVTADRNQFAIFGLV